MVCTLWISIFMKIGVFCEVLFTVLFSECLLNNSQSINFTKFCLRHDVERKSYTVLTQNSFVDWSTRSVLMNVQKFSANAPKVTFMCCDDASFLSPWSLEEGEFARGWEFSLLLLPFLLPPWFRRDLQCNPVVKKIFFQSGRASPSPVAMLFFLFLFFPTFLFSETRHFRA